MTTPFKQVIPFCEKIMQEHSKNKGDSWKDCDVMYLRGKLVEEFAEVILDPSNPRELADLINIASMLLYRYIPKE